MEEIHLSHLSMPFLRQFLKEYGFRIVKSCNEFQDPYIFATPAVQIVRHILYSFAKALEFITYWNFLVYNTLFIVAEKE